LDPAGDHRRFERAAIATVARPKTYEQGQLLINQRSTPSVHLAAAHSPEYRRAGSNL
jgi:hypothetical protein